MINQISEDLKEMLSEERYQHTIRVAEMAVDLARCHGEDAGLARIAALCHDYAKCVDHQSYPEIAVRLDSGLDEYMMKDLGLAHGLIGALLTEERYGLGSQDVFNAISYHTYGRPAMSRLEKIIYLADYVEIGRVFPGVEEIRSAAREDLNLGMKLALQSTIAHVESRNKQVHPNSREALEYYMNEEVSV